ncbi:hypothetical protein HNS38_18525 [Lentimicrobium sp. L6]|uniref:alpha-2-macroglobulin family protein n=1 Tax=Lentimicrobium sp. L6 TaxID=2735916 RepID=UPI001554F1B2|nr:MG2 domain-containing protein [Lentimicrobium sp. L6]NPD86765.1 hypothetical protein [Lentimicrobium sp. L6]
MNPFSSNKLGLIITVFLFVILFTNCSDEKKPLKIDPAYTSYITAFTGDVVSNQSNIKVRLSQSHSGAVSGEALAEPVFDFSPKVAGQAFWLDAQTIEFRPEKQLPSGQLFKAEFSLGKLLQVPSELEKFEFQFQVMKQSIDIRFEAMNAYDKSELKWQVIEGVALSYDFAQTEALESGISAYQKGKKLSIRWQHQDGGKMHYFTIDSVERKAKVEEVILHWDGKALGINEEGEKKFEIPSLSDFSVLDVKVIQSGEPSIQIQFSDPIDQELDLTGLIYFSPELSIRTLIQDNQIKVFPNQKVTGSYKLMVSSSIKNKEAYQLGKTFEKVVSFKSLKPAVELIGEGNILPSSNGLVFPFKAVGLSAVNIKIIKVFEDNIMQFLQNNQLSGTEELKRVGRLVYKGELPLKSEEAIDYGQWNNFAIDLSSYIEVDPGAIYRIVLSFDINQSLYVCENEDGASQLQADEVTSSDEDWDSPSGYYYYYDSGNNSYYGANYNYYERDDPCKISYYLNSSNVVGRNILASDLGIIAKGGHGNHLLVAITDLRNTLPMAGVDVEIYNFQQQLIETQTTDINGFVQVDLHKKPYLLIAKNDKQRGYLRLDDGSALSLSMFDIGGQRNEKGIKGYMYGERGVWRPGDSLYMTFMLEDRERTLPLNHPVVFELYTPRQQLFYRTVSNNSVGGIYDFRTATSADAETGMWRAKVKVGGAVFTKNLRIEAIKPNRLKVKLDFGTPLLAKDKTIKGEIEVKWLHGAIASDLKTDVEMKLSPYKKAFPKYDGYSFQDKSRSFYSEAEMVFDGQVNEDGIAEMQPKINVGDHAPGMLKANFKIRAFEKGGDFSVNRMSIPYSPYSSYVGVKIPEVKGWNGALYSDEDQMIPIVTVDENGNPVDRKGLKIEIYNIYWRWWWERSSDNDLAHYVSNRHEYLLKSETIDTKDGKAQYKMNLGGQLYGRKYIRVVDPISGHSTGKEFYVTYNGWGDSGENPGGAEMLTFSTDKEKYQIGETIKVNIPTAKGGRILVSVETGARIIKNFWVNLSEEEKDFELEATEEMSPNVYIHLTLLQAHNQMKNDLPIRMFGVQSISVENAASHLHPQITMPKELEPEKKFKVKVEEANGRKMSYTLAVVDDGLLDLTNFKTPSPWSHFNAKEALSVRTWDMYTYVMGAFTGKMAGLLAIGGDEAANADGGAKANRFKPVVKFLGPFELGANGKNEHEILMPNYVGSVRTMLIAKEGTAYGSVDETSPVKKPLMVLATLPRVVGPDETVTLPVTVFAMDDQIKNVKVKVEANSLFHVLESKEQMLTFERQGDKVANFQLKVADAIGIGKVKVEVSSGSEKAIYEVELDVRAPNPRIADVESAVLEAGETWTTQYSPVGIDGTNTGTLEVSNIPPLNLEKRMSYLIRYPHGCIEQTTSAVFAQLYLSNFVELSPNQTVKTEENIKAALNKLRSFQTYLGGFSYWPGMDENNAWGSNYAGHFMLEAQAKGYALPPGLLHNWVNFQKQEANSWTSEGTAFAQSQSQLTQAYRLYTLALADAPALGAMNRLKNRTDLNVVTKYCLASAYYMIGKKTVAEKMIKDAGIKVDTKYRYSNTYGSENRNKAIVLETLALLGEKSNAKILFDELSSSLASDRWLSTQTTAYSLLAISKFIGTTDLQNQELTFQVKFDQQAGEKIKTSAHIKQIDLDFKNTKERSLSIKNTAEQTQFVRLLLEGIPAIGDTTNAENHLKMNITYRDLDGKKIDPKNLKQGSDFMAEVELVHPGIREGYRDMALTQIFPSGWEIRNMRMDEGFSGPSESSYTYQDIRDDRVLTYFDLDRRQRKTFIVLLNAAYQGKYYLPTTYCEAMYDHDINARVSGEWVEVK